MNNGHLIVESSGPLRGAANLVGAKNAVLVTIASLILTSGKSIVRNVPVLTDVFEMVELLKKLGAQVYFDTENHILFVDTSDLHAYEIDAQIMAKTRTSILAMGPLLARFGKVRIGGLPGGDAIGKRPIDYHLKNFEKMGITIFHQDSYLCAQAENLIAARVVLEYPSVGATENVLMAATMAQGRTKIINASCEPEVLDLIAVLEKMGAKINIHVPATIIVEGVDFLTPVDHTIMFDRLEAGSLLIAAAATGGEISIPDASADVLDVFLLKLTQMGHEIAIGQDGKGIYLKATSDPQAVSFKTGPYPGFPTDLQAPMMALQCISQGTAIIEETVFENRFHHVPELKKMGASIEIEGNKAIITGVGKLYGTQVCGADIRAAMALVIAGLAAQGETHIDGLYHLRRGYESLEHRLRSLGAKIKVENEVLVVKAHNSCSQLER